MEGVEDVEHGEGEKEQEDEAEEGGRRALLGAAAGGRLHCPRCFRWWLCSRGTGTSSDQSSSVSSWTAEKVAGGSEQIRAGGERKRVRFPSTEEAEIGRLRILLAHSQARTATLACHMESWTTIGKNKSFLFLCTCGMRAKKKY